MEELPGTGGGIKVLMDHLRLGICPKEEERSHRRMEVQKGGKEYFVRFKVEGKDVSSTSGEIEGWLSRDLTPVKGTIKDVILFGDLWGELIKLR